jgi:hypothetical protein
MKIVISESQYKKLIEAEEEQKILKMPSIALFNNDWFLLQRPIESLGNLTTVGKGLNLMRTPIESLGNLEYVGGSLYLQKTPIKSFGNLKTVGGNLELYETPLSKMYSENEIRKMVNVQRKLM